MIRSLRPSKIFLFNYLENRLNKINGGIGLDASSADFKNRRMFRTEFYYGFDINQVLLERGLLKYGDDKKVGACPDNQIC